jgi:hypothetical protein
VVTDYTAGAFCTRSGSGHNNWRNIAISLIDAPERKQLRQRADREDYSALWRNAPAFITCRCYRRQRVPNSFAFSANEWFPNRIPVMVYTWVEVSPTHHKKRDEWGTRRFGQ